MKITKLVRILSITTFLLITLFLTGCHITCAPNPQMCFEKNCYNLEIPITQEEMQQGLMFRESLPEDQGMLFRFKETQKHAFWMKNTLIPLDMIWIDENHKVVHITTAVPCTQDPCTIYAPDIEALYVLELNAGQAKQNNITIGSTATIVPICEE